MEPTGIVNEQLVDYGALGLFLITAITLVWILVKFIKRQIDDRIKEKDAQILFLQKVVDEDKEATKQLISQYASQQAKVINIMDRQVEQAKENRIELLNKIEQIPQQTKDLILLSQKDNN